MRSSRTELKTAQFSKVAGVKTYFKVCVSATVASTDYVGLIFEYILAQTRT